MVLNFRQSSNTIVTQDKWLFIIEGVGVVCGVRRVVAG